MNDKFYYRCTDCGKEYRKDEAQYLCPECAASNSETQPPKGVLKVMYDYAAIKQKYADNNLFSGLRENQFLDILPIESPDSLPVLRVGQTPLYLSAEAKQKNFKLYFKDDSQNPTYSYKDRASAMVSAYAKEQGFETIVAASTGNAGSSLAGICASQKQKAVIMVPEKAPIAKLTQILMYGAEIVPVKGTYDNAFDLSIEATKAFGWYNRNTAYNPITVEGKKTVAFELYEQLGGKIPEYIFVPVGDGCIISGVYKGFEDLLNLEIIEKMPTIVAVQSEGSRNLADNLHTETFELKPSNTLADSISVDIPRNFYMARQFLLNYNGKTAVVSDQAILQASKKLASENGLFAEPAAAAAYAGYLQFAEEQPPAAGSDAVVLLTGSGLKDLQSVQKLLDIPKAVSPNLEALKIFLGGKN